MNILEVANWGKLPKHLVEEVGKLNGLHIKFVL